GRMLEEVLKLLGKGGGRVVDGFQSLLVTGILDAPSDLDAGLSNPTKRMITRSQKKKTGTMTESDIIDVDDQEKRSGSPADSDRGEEIDESDGDVDKQLGLKIARLKLKNKRLKRKFKRLEIDNNEYLKVSTSDINLITKELANVKADADMLTLENVSLDKWSAELTGRNEKLTSEIKNMSGGNENLKRQLKDKDEENERLRAEMRDMKTKLDEANLKGHEFVENLTEERHNRWERQTEKLTNENAALTTARQDLEDA
ncbi:hypothetical protein Dimus_013729, partial [Dionaea muscipula]